MATKPEQEHTQLPAGADCEAFSYKASLSWLLYLLTSSVDYPMWCASSYFFCFLSELLYFYFDIFIRAR